MNEITGGSCTLEGAKVLAEVANVASSGGKSNMLGYVRISLPVGPVMVAHPDVYDLLPESGENLDPVQFTNDICTAFQTAIENGFNFYIYSESRTDLIKTNITVAKRDEEDNLKLLIEVDGATEDWYVSNVQFGGEATVLFIDDIEAFHNESTWDGVIE